jgi:hypothetical protein
MIVLSASSSSPSTKQRQQQQEQPQQQEIWCFGCNSTMALCNHNECPEHCDMCVRIKEIKSKLERYM